MRFNLCYKMKKISKVFVLALFLHTIYYIQYTSVALADWPMAGANPARTSWVSETIPDVISAQWAKPIYPLVSQRVQVIGAEGKVYVSTAAGLYAFDANSGADSWRYATALPLGHSPTYVNENGIGYLYVGGLDKKIHKVRASNGQGVWTTTNADGGYVTSPIVANNKVYATNRDGALYAFNTSDGSTAWPKFQTGNQINQSPAYDGTNLYFASNDGYAYAVNATTGSQVWRSSAKLPSMGFYSWWPVIYQNYVIFTRTTFGSGHTGEETDYLLCPPSTTRPVGCTPSSTAIPGTLGTVSGSWVAGTATLDLNNNPHGMTFADYFEQFPHYRNNYFFNKSTGQEQAFDIDNDGRTDAAPVGWSGDGGTPAPPIVSGFDNVLYFRTYTRAGGGFGSKTIAGWKIGTGIISVPYSNLGGQSGYFAGDEPAGFTAAGDKIYYNWCCDRIIGGINIARPNTDFFGTTDDNNRQWKYMNSGGLPFYPFSNIGIPSNYFVEANKFFWDPPLPAVFWNENDKVGPSVYNGKLYTILGNALIAFGAGGAGSNAPMLPSAPNIAPPTFTTTVTTTQLRSTLEQEVQQMVNAGHLKPSFLHSGNITSYRSRWLDDYLSDYWHNTSDTIIILLRALPHLSSSLQAQVKTYLQNEFANYSPISYAHNGFASGTQRDPWPYPPVETAFRSLRYIAMDKQVGSNFNNNWSIPPTTVYALWKYAQAGLATPQSLLSSWGTRLKTPIEANFGSISGIAINSSNIQSYFKSYPLVHNAYIGAYYGYIELAKMAGQTSSQYAPFTTELNKLLTWRVQNMMAFPDPQEPYMCEHECYFESLITHYNFAYMTQELADYLRTNARSSDPNKDVLAILQKYQDIAPYWMQAHNAETQGESAIQPYQQTHSMFQGLARVKRASQAELLKYLDTPIVPVGDLYYIDNLTAVLEASGTIPTNPPPPAPSATPAGLQGDLNNDGHVNMIDYNILIASFGTTYNIYDYNNVVTNFEGTNSPTPTPGQTSSLMSATGMSELPASEWVWPLTPTLTSRIHELMDEAITQTRNNYGATQPKLIMLVNGTSLLGDFAAKAQAAFPNALVVGTGPGNVNYNAFTDNRFFEHNQRPHAVLALGGSNITQVRSSGQHSVGQGSDAQLQITAGSQIAQDIKPYLDTTKKNLIHFFGPGHNPNHKLVLCGFKQAIASVTNQCDPANPNNPELPGLPQLPAHVRVAGTSGYYNANTVVNTSVVSQSVIGVLIQGSFGMSLKGFAGTPTTTNITTPISQMKTELGGVPEHLFLIPGHPTVGEYEALRQQFVSLLPGTSIFGHEGGGETGHEQTTSPATAVIDHTFMVGLKGN